MARSFTPLAIRTLAGICASAKAPAAARVGAAEALLNRGWGKALTELNDEREVRVVIRHIVQRLGEPQDELADGQVIEHQVDG